MANPKRPLLPEEVQSGARAYIDFEKQEVRNATSAVLTHCPICGKEKWKNVSKIRRDKVSPYCSACVRCELLKPPDVPSEYLDYYDFNSQRLRDNLSNPYRSLCILVTCPNCGLQRWQKVVSVRHRFKTPYCNQCSHLYYLSPDETPEQFFGQLDFSQQKVIDGHLCIRNVCPICQITEWISVCRIRIGDRQSPICNSCGTTQRNRAGGKGRYITKEGYVNLTISHLFPEDQVLARAMYSNRSTIAEHRLVMARHLGRPLDSYEHVHHRSSNRADNRLANLRLVLPNTHHTAPADAIAKLVTEIEARARALRRTQVDPIPYLKKYLKQLDSLIPSKLLWSGLSITYHPYGNAVMLELITTSS